MKTLVTHENFDEEFEKARLGESALYIPTYTRCIVINAKTIAKFAKTGIPVLRKSTDGKGFRMGSGSGSIYILPGQLVSVAQ